MADILKHRLLTEKEVAERLRVSVSTVRNWRYTYQGPPVQKVGRSVRYDILAVQKWLDEHQQHFESGAS